MPSPQQSITRRFGSYTMTLLPESARIAQFTNDVQRRLTEYMKESAMAGYTMESGTQVGLPDIFRYLSDPKINGFTLEQIAKEFGGREVILTRSVEYTTGRCSVTGLLDSQAYLRGLDSGTTFHAPKLAENLLHFINFGKTVMALLGTDRYATIRFSVEHCYGYTFYFSGMFKTTEMRGLSLKIDQAVPVIEGRFDSMADSFPESDIGVFDRMFVELFRWFGFHAHIGTVDENWRPHVR
ncbi:MAG: hypothetical protein OEM52_06535 [bacterium]|nr:hypothetical protein [bacterium]